MKRKLLTAAVALPFAIGIVTGITVTGAAASLLGSSIFQDVKAGMFYDAAVGDLNARGVIKGYDNGNFGPDDYVTRGQVAVMMERLSNDLRGIPNTDSTSSTAQTVSRSSRSSSTASSVSSVDVSNAAGGAIHLSVGSFSVSDIAPKLSLSVVRSGATTNQVTVNYTLTGGTAIAGTDYEASNGSVTFFAGESTKIITFTVKKNTAATSNRTVDVILSNPTGGAALGSPSTAVVTLVHAGAVASGTGSSVSSGASSSVSSTTGPKFAFSAQEYGVLEAAGSMQITVVRTGVTSAAATIAYATSNGTATSGYTPATGTLSFAAGETSKTFTVSVADNAVIEGDRYINLTLSNPSSGAGLGYPFTSKLTIIDDDRRNTTTSSGTLSFSASTYTVSHTAGELQIPVRRSGTPLRAASVDYATSNGTAVAGSEYTAVSGTLNFAPGESVKIITVPIANKNTADMSFNIQLSNIQGDALAGANVTAAVNIEM